MATGTAASRQALAGLRCDAIGLREVLFVCETNYTSIAKMPKRYLRQAAFGGIHDQLRELATSL